MPYAANETSVASARPLELFKFVGNFATYRYTSHPIAITNTEGTYLPETISRTAVKTGNQEESTLALDIEVPYDNAMALAYAYLTAPPSLELFLYRAHQQDYNDTLLQWSGAVISFLITGRVCKLRVPSLFGYVLDGVAPPPKYQGPCNHILYDTRCSVLPGPFEHVTTVSTIVGSVVTLASNPFADGATTGGEMEYTVGGERRMIISNVGTAFTVATPFAGLSVSDTVTIRNGCDHSFATCKSKFSNGLNFGGFPLVPDRNPFKTRL